jgi:hypothetical protein
MVKPISAEPRMAASSGLAPSSTWRKMFSSMTIASSMTKPTDTVRAMRETLSRVKLKRYIAASVPSSDRGIAIAGISVACQFPRDSEVVSVTPLYVPCSCRARETDKGRDVRKT